jgi:NitT/TauT family transport system substrate-binding protein
LHRWPSRSVRSITDWYPQPEHGGFYQAMAEGLLTARPVIDDGDHRPAARSAFAVPRDRPWAGRTFGDGQRRMTRSTANDRGIPVGAVGATMQNDPQGHVPRFNDLPGDALWPTSRGRRRRRSRPGTAWFPYLVQASTGFKNAPRRCPTPSAAACFPEGPELHPDVLPHQRAVFMRKLAGAGIRGCCSSADIRLRHPTACHLHAPRIPAEQRGGGERLRRGQPPRLGASYLADPSFVHGGPAVAVRQLNPGQDGLLRQVLVDDKFVLGDPAKGESQGLMKAERWQFQFDTLKERGVIKGKFNVADTWTGEFIPKP